MTVERYGDLDSIRGEWSTLALASGNVFATWEWNAVWWRRFSQGAQPIVLALRSPVGRLRGLIPMYRHEFPAFRVARLLGHGPADQGSLVFDVSDTSCPADLLEAAIRSVPRVDLIVGEQLDATSEVMDVPGAKVLTRQSAPRIEIGHSDWSRFLQSLGSATRASVRRKERRLARRRSFVIRLTMDGAQLDRDLDDLFSLHSMRWPGSSFAGLEPFHREFAATALENGWLRLWILEADGVAAAAWYGFRYGNTEHYYQSGWHPDFAADSVGQVLLMHTIRAALEDGVSEYRFGRGGEAYKYHYANAETPLATVAWPRNVLGAGAAVAAPLISRFRGLRRVRDAVLGQS